MTSEETSQQRFICPKDGAEIRTLFRHLPLWQTFNPLIHFIVWMNWWMNELSLACFQKSDLQIETMLSYCILLKMKKSWPITLTCPALPALQYCYIKPVTSQHVSVMNVWQLCWTEVWAFMCLPKEEIWAVLNDADDILTSSISH